MHADRKRNSLTMSFAPVIGQPSYGTPYVTPGSEEFYQGERLLAKGEMNIDDVAEKTGSRTWCLTACLSLAALPIAPLMWCILSPCGNEERVRSRLLANLFS